MDTIELNYRFDISDKSNWKSFLHENGFVVFKSVILKEDCDNAVLEMRKCLCKLSKKLKLNRINTLMLPSVMVQQVICL